MERIKALDVLWIWDGCIEPPGPKMVVCIEPLLGYYFRINTEPNWQTPILLTVQEHAFLKHDSHLECGEPLELDEYIIEESMKREGIIGQVSDRLAADIYQAVDQAKTITAPAKDAIRKAIGY